MEPVYVFGHRNPDTDSIVSSMAYASLCNALGDNDYIAVRLGHVNDETTFLLERFGMEAPPYLNTVRTQVRDIAYDTPPTIASSVPVSHAWRILQEDGGHSALPVTDENGHLFSMVTAGSIAESDMRSITCPAVDHVPVFNLLSALEGRIINDEDDIFGEISGEVVFALPSSPNHHHGIREGSIVICGQQEDVVEEALRQKASCIILCQTDLAEKYRGMSSSTCIIVTPCDGYRAARMLYQAIPVSRVCETNELVYFHLNDFIDDVQETVLKSRYRSYPILDVHDHVVGTLGRFHLLRPRRKRVVLMDHNEKSQSVAGLEQAEIVGIIDHHRLADVQTGYPVFMRNEPVGSTTTIVATMYQERGLMPAPKLAGLMAAAILSDTVLFKSPTCTPLDKRIAERLARIAGVDLDELGREIFSIGTSPDKPAEEILTADFKEFHIAGQTLGIGQATCLDTEGMMSRIDELLEAMSARKDKRGYDMILLMLTDVLREGTELVFLGDSSVISMAFSTNEIKGHHVFLPGVVSRKKQIVPALAQLWG